MHPLRPAILAFAAALCAWLAHADTNWTTVTLAPGITIDVPTVVATDFNPPGGTPDDLMLIALKNRDGNTMDCLLTRIPYTKDMPREKTVALLTAKKHGGLCAGPGGASVTGHALETVDAATNSGRPAGSCVASYTDASKTPPGRVTTTFAVADEAKLYMLSCEIAAPTQDVAMEDWYVDWLDVISRLDKSLHLPPP